MNFELKSKILERLTIFMVMIFSIGNAEIKIASIFTSNMVVQRGMAVPVWGTASPSESVAVNFNSQFVKTIADTNGKWMVKLSSMKEGGPFVLTVKGKNEIRLENILIGEVWICSGQSNMTFELEKSLEGELEISKANYPSIRLFTVPRIVSETLKTSCKGEWSVCSPTSIPKFSAVGYYFGKYIHQSLNVPVGLIHVSWGGTAAEGWVPKEVLEKDSDFVPILNRWNQDVVEYPKAMKEFQEQLPKLTEQWNIDSASAVANGKMLPRKPTAPRGPGHRDTPTGQYNGMLGPIIPIAMRGVIWYQGEANASRAFQYRKLFPALINCWRNVWQEGDFPFYYVQLPNLDRQPEPSKSGWAEIRESQLLTLKLPNTGMAVTIDVGDPKNLHPTNKKPVGERLALAALAQTYGKKIEYSGPIANGVAIEKNVIRLTFSHADGGLVTRNNEKLVGFTIAGDDKKFVSADATIRGNEIIASSLMVKKPVSVRYAWADNPTCNLYNKSGFPASPFRTDDWQEVTFGKK